MLSSTFCTGKKIFSETFALRPPSYSHATPTSAELCPWEDRDFAEVLRLLMAC